MWEFFTNLFLNSRLDKKIVQIFACRAELSVAIGFGCDTDMGFEETVEESDIVKTEIEPDLFDLAVSDLQLALGVRNDGFDDDVTGSSLSDGFDGGTEVR